MGWEDCLGCSVVSKQTKNKLLLSLLKNKVILKDQPIDINRLFPVQFDMCLKASLPETTPSFILAK